MQGDVQIERALSHDGDHAYLGGGRVKAASSGIQGVWMNF